MGRSHAMVTGRCGDAYAHPTGSGENDFGDSGSVYVFHADMRT